MRTHAAPEQGPVPEGEGLIPVAAQDDRAEILALFEHSTDIVTILEADGTWRATNAAGARVLGWPPDLDPGPRGLLSYVHEDDRHLVAGTFADILSGEHEPEAPVVLRVEAADGTWRHLETWTRDLRDDPVIAGIVITSRDVTEQVVAQERVQLLSRVLEASQELVTLCDPTGRVLYANAIARDEYGVTEGKMPVEMMKAVFPWEEAQLESDVLPTLRRDGVWSGEMVVRNRHGVGVPLAVTLQVHQIQAGGNTEIISTIAHDISELKSTQAQLEHQATHDPLTALPNRPLFQELGEQALARSDRYGTTVAVLFLDLDRFKPVNDSFGHATGDELLVQIAARLRGSVRRGDVVARFGGDEFVVLCEHPAGRTEMLELAQRIIDALAEPVDVGGISVSVGTSVGIAIGGGRVTIDTLIRDADAALYQAKEEGRGRAVLFGSRG